MRSFPLTCLISLLLFSALYAQDALDDWLSGDNPQAHPLLQRLQKLESRVEGLEAENARLRKDLESPERFWMLYGKAVAWRKVLRYVSDFKQRMAATGSAEALKDDEVNRLILEWARSRFSLQEMWDQRGDPEKLKGNDYEAIMDERQRDLNEVHDEVAGQLNELPGPYRDGMLEVLEQLRILPR